jgi:UDP-galactopyranose mutase
VFYFEEAVFGRTSNPQMMIEAHGSLDVAVPHLPENLSSSAINVVLRSLVDELARSQRIERPLLWYYTPMALDFTDHLQSSAIVYDCMDELAAFQGAPDRLREREAALVERAALMLTGGRSLYEAKRLQYRHPNIHAFPSSVDTSHFAQARTTLPGPPDQDRLPRPRLGFFGVLDERLDIELIDGVAAARPDWQLVMVGPVVKIDPASLPRRPNIQYLGPKGYGELPAYLAGWDVALLPFARNEATRFISPTKTPEYLAAGKPVVSTSIRDVVRPYGDLGLVRIADDAPGFVRACEAALAEDRAPQLAAADAFLRTTSWDATWASIDALITEVSQRAADRSEQPGAIAV